MKLSVVLAATIALFAATISAQDANVTVDANTTATDDDSKFQPLILGGTVVPSGTKTYVTGVRSTAAGTDFCGGTLIAPKYVLTAAHCYGSIKYVSVGTHYLSGRTDGEQIAVVKQTRHPSYVKSTHSYDFLILELATASSFTPATLAAADDSDIVVGASATVMGWGTTSEDGDQSYELLKVSVPLLSNTACSQVLSVDSTMVCAGGKTNKDSCQGDSGGPLVVGSDVLVGVVSWGEGCGQAGYPGVYGRVSKVRAWIKSIAGI